MWEEPTNSVGTGANVALPPAHEPPGIPASKKKKSMMVELKQVVNL